MRVIETLPSGWRGRTLALSLALLALAILYVVAVAPLLDLYAERTVQIETRRSLLAKLNAVANELPTLRERLAGLRTNADSDKLTLSGGNDAVASAALQVRLQELATANGVTIRSSESLASQSQGPFRSIVLRLMLSAPYQGLVKLLAAIETARPPLIIDELRISSFQWRPDATSNPALDASLQVHAFRAAETATPAK